MAKRTALEAAQLAGDQTGRIFIVTGGYGGIGVETVKALLAVGGTVVIACRSEDRMNMFIKDTLEAMDITDEARLTGIEMDLGDLESVRAFCDTFKAQYTQLDVLINNAGINNGKSAATKQGIESQFGVNVVGHFLLTKEMLPLLKASEAGGRVVELSSSGHAQAGAPRFDREYYEQYNVETSPYSPFLQYQQSKLANILVTKATSMIHDIDCVSVHPGAIASTGLVKNYSFANYLRFAASIFTEFHILKEVFRSKTEEQGASTTITAALSDNIVRGGYYADCELTQPSPCAEIEEDAQSAYDYCNAVTAPFQS